MKKGRRCPFYLPNCYCVLDRGSRVFPVQPRNEGRADLGGANRFALIVIGAIAEAQLVHFSDHSKDTSAAVGLTLGEQSEMGDFCCYKQHRR